MFGRNHGSMDHAHTRHITQVKLIVMKGAGGKAFCAGGDVVGVRQAVLDGVSKQADLRPPALVTIK